MTSQISETDVEGMFLTHIRLIHLSDLLAERTTRLNGLNAKIAEENYARYEKLAAAGLETKEIISLIGSSGTAKINSESEEKIDFPEWAKDQTYESWKLEFEYYKDSVLGAYKKQN